MNYQELNGCTIAEGFYKFNKENPQVYKAFKQMALEAIEKGKKKLSAKLIINVIRWNKFMETTDQTFKINDAYQSYFARHFVKEFPDHADKFEFRKLRNEQDSPYITVAPNGQLSFH